MTEMDDARDCDLIAQKNPFPPTILEYGTLGKGIWIPPGKLVQLRYDCRLGEGTNAQTSVWLVEVWEMETVERELE